MPETLPQTIALGESAVLLNWGNCIDKGINRQVHLLAAALHNQDHSFILDIIPAYCSITIVFDIILFTTAHNNTPVEFISSELLSLSLNDAGENNFSKPVFEIPVCYDPVLGNDLESLSLAHSIDPGEIVSLHLSSSYYVYMLGFLPGFSYMGEVDEKIAFPRKEKPLWVKAGSVGIAGKQTGIYPVDSPGGWHILGHTPIKMFDATKVNPCLLEPGATVNFKAIDIDAFHHLENQYPA